MPLQITALPLELLFCIASYLNLEDFVKFGKTQILGEALHDERINKEMVKVRCQTHCISIRLPSPLLIPPNSSPMMTVIVAIIIVLALGSAVD